jgi:DNA-directed RNA polymerase specialized sigma24 family protein
MGTTEYFDEELYEMSGARNDVETLISLDEVVSLLKRIPQALASILQAHVVLGKSYEDIARENHISVGAVRVRIHRAKEACKRALLL